MPHLAWSLQPEEDLQDGWEITAVIRKSTQVVVLGTEPRLCHQDGGREPRGNSMPYHNPQEALCFTCTIASFLNMQLRTALRRDKQQVYFMIAKAYNPITWVPSCAQQPGGKSVALVSVCPWIASPGSLSP